MKKKLLLLSTLFASSLLFAFKYPTRQDTKLAQSIKNGEAVYASTCASCHGPKGKGVEGIFPPLAQADYVNESPSKVLIGQVLKGSKGKIVVNGLEYNGEMPAQDHLTDKQIADVLNYVKNSWGNKGKQITPAEVKLLRNSKGKKIGKH